MTVNLQESIKASELFRVPSKYTNKHLVAGISDITIKGLRLKYPQGIPSVAFKLSSAEVRVANLMICTLEGLELLSSNDGGDTKCEKRMNAQGNVICEHKRHKG